MQIQFLVTVTIGRRDAQPLSEFKKEDAAAFVPYLKEKITDAVSESWQYNAMVDKVKVAKKQKIEPTN